MNPISTLPRQAEALVQVGKPGPGNGRYQRHPAGCGSQDDRLDSVSTSTSASVVGAGFGAGDGSKTNPSCCHMSSAPADPMCHLSMSWAAARMSFVVRAVAGVQDALDRRGEGSCFRVCVRSLRDVLFSCRLPIWLVIRRMVGQREI